MITKKFVYLTSIIVFFSSIFISCKLNASDELLSKTTIKPFDHLKDPVVIAQQVMWTTTIFGLDISSKLIGSVLIVIDFDTNSVYDWIYVPNLYGYDTRYCCKTNIGDEEPPHFLFLLHMI